MQQQAAEARRIMAAIKCAVFLMVLVCRGIQGDTEVSCLFMESCMLPCSFQSGADANIDWTLAKPSQTIIYSYYFNQDELTQQDQRFRGRASLFKDQLSNGNASLLLTGVKVQDEGRYKCHTSTINGTQDSFIDLKVNAPVQEVNIEMVGNRITCSSEGIYPEPALTWSTKHVSVFESTTIVQRSGELYSITSSVLPPDTTHVFSDLTYSCTVSTRSNRKSVTSPNRSQNENIAKVMVAAVIVVAVILGLIPICCNKLNKKAGRCGVRQNQQPPEPAHGSPEPAHGLPEPAHGSPEPAHGSDRPQVLLTEASQELLALSSYKDDPEGASQSAAAEPTGT